MERNAAFLERKTQPRIFIWCFLFVSAISVVAHFARFSDPYLSHDALFLDRSADFGWQISIGRYFQPVYYSIIGTDISSVWLAGLLSICFLSGVAYLLVRMLRIRSALCLFAASGLLALNQSTIVLYAVYIEHADIFSLGMLFSAMAAFSWFCVKRGSGIRRNALLVVAGSLSLWVSLGVYQYYITFFIGLVMLITLLRLKSDARLIDTLRLVLPSVGIVIVAGVLYVAGMDVASWLTGVPQTSTYNSTASVMSGFAANEFVSLIMDAYKDILSYVFAAGSYNGLTMAFFNLVFGLVVFALYIRLVLCRGWKHLVIALGVIALLPLGLNIVYVLSHGYTYELMTSSLILVYVFGLRVMEGSVSARSRFFVKIFISLASCVLVISLLWNGFVYAQGYYTLKSYKSSATEMTVNRVIDAMEDVEGYKAGETPVLLVGRLDENPVASYVPSGFERYYQDETRDHPGDLSVTYPLTYGAYFNFVMQYPCDLHFASTEPEYEELEESEAVASMPVFPEKGYCALHDGVLVVRLS